MKSLLKDALILFLITLVAGGALGFVYSITKEPIANEKAASELKSYSEVFAAASDFVAADDISLPVPSDKQSDWVKAGFSDVTIDKLLLAKDAQGNTLGYVLLVTTKAGYGGDIKFSMGITKEGNITSLSLLSISETAGLGMRAPTDLVPQFADQKAMELILVKTGNASDGQIDAMSGATITSNAITTAVNGGIYFFQNMLGGGTYEG